MSAKIFIWESNKDKEDLTCKIGHYILRVEQMNKGHWWWRVYCKGEPITTVLNEYSRSKYLAIGLCEGLYLGHKSNQEDK